MIEIQLSKFWRYTIIASVIWMFITAWFSSGYYYFDEHYQIIEFARLKLGYNSASDLAWEFHERARSSIQPVICFIILKTASIFNILDPHYQALLIRSISGLVTIFTITFFIKKTIHLIDQKLRPTYIFLSYFIWFVPFNSVRFTSETWSALTFIGAMGFCMDNNERKKYNIIGLLLGLSFLFRFQSAIMAVGMLMWYIFIEKDKVSNIIKIAIVALITIIFGVLSDYWFYGEFTLAPLNYFTANLIEGKVNNFGVSPWYEQIKLLLFGPVFPIGLIIVMSFIIILIKRPKNLMLWCIIPFIIVHTLIPHKELRFIFPLAFFVPLQVILAFQIIYEHHFLKRSRVEIIVRLALIFLAIVNCLALIIMGFKPADAGQKNIVNYIAEHYSAKNIILFYTAKDDPYNPILPLREKFYLNKFVSCKEIKDLDSLMRIEDSRASIYLLCTREDPYKILSSQQTILDPVERKKGIPSWIQLFTTLYKDIEENSALTLYELRKIN